INKENKRVIEGLKRDDNIVVTKADKGNMGVVLDKMEYVGKCQIVLEDMIYKQIEKDLTRRFQRRLDLILSEVVKQSRSPQIGNMRQQPVEKVPRIPRMFGLPKVHKDGIPIRPVISHRSNIFYKVARYLGKSLSRYVNSKRRSVVNEFVQRLSDIRIEEDEIVVRFTNMEVKVGVDELMWRVREDKGFSDGFGMSAGQIEVLLRLICLATYFEFEGGLYEQSSGLPVGSLNPLLVNVFIEVVEGGEIWVRYVDDMFVVLKEGFLDRILVFTNSLYPRLEFTCEKWDNGRISFLDCQVQVREDGSMTTSVFRKKSDVGKMLDFRRAFSLC
uniref:Reverse transcriptase domain-containing protein n=1 Tax=Latimeria chalumnae TaxID=7897 RepID=H3AA55_LATCH